MNLLKYIFRKNKKIENLSYYLYTRWTYFKPTIESFYLNILINVVRKSIIKKEIASLTILPTDTFISLNDNRKFFWEPWDRTSLIGMALLGEWEQHETNFLKNIIHKGDTAIDVGGNYGFHTTLFSSLVGEKGSVHVFEPLNFMVDRMKKNLSINHLPNNIVINTVGLSDKKGQAPMYVYPDLGPGAASGQKRWFGKYEKVMCQLITLDEYVTKNRIKRVDVIKCDVEGAELLVFKGAYHTLQKFHPMLLFEVTGAGAKFGYTQHEQFEYLQSLGYAFYEFKNDKPIEIVDTTYFYGNCFAKVK